MCDTNSTSGCDRADNVRPGECSKEQIRTCHGETGNHPCVKDGCADPSQLVRDPSNCTPEQNRQFHGDGEHPCNQQQRSTNSRGGTLRL